MEHKICKNCNKSFRGNDEFCDACKIIKGKTDDKMNKLIGTTEALAVMKSYKELRK